MSRHYFIEINAQWVAISFVLFWISADVLSAPTSPKLPLYSPNQILVSFQPGTAAADIGRVHQLNGGRVLKHIKAIGLDVVSVPDGTVLNSIKVYQNNPNVKYAEPNYYRPLIVPNEGNFSATLDAFEEQWNLSNQGQVLQTYQDPNTLAPWEYTIATADIKAPAAWDISQGNALIKIAIPDSGVDCDHPDLFAKCIENLDFVTATEDPYGTPIPDLIDRLGHGTHVAGTAAADTNNNTGIAGVGAGVSFGSLKVCYAIEFIGIVVGSNCEDADIVDALTYAADQSYNVINMSFGGAPSQAVKDAIDYAYAQGVVMVSAAGNNYNWEKFYPAAYDNVISVGATDPMDNLAYFSTFSKDNDDWVDVLAPGHPILSTMPSIFCGQAGADCLGWNSGTSMSSPHGAGLAALVWSQLLNNDPDLLNNLSTKTSARDEIISRFRNPDCSDSTGAMGQNMLAWSKYGRLNAQKMLSCGSVSPPPPPAYYVSVTDIAVNALNIGQGSKYATAVVTLVDSDGAAISGVSVLGSFSGKTNETPGALSTDSSGTVTFTSSPAKGGGEWCFEVTAVGHEDYDSSSNAVTKSCQSGDVY